MDWKRLGSAIWAGALNVIRHPVLSLALGLAGMLAVAYIERQGAAQHESELQAYFQQQRALNDSTQARTAAERLKHDRELAGLVAAAQQLNGKLVAGLALSVAQRDTVIRHDTLATTRLLDSTRTARLHDSTFAGIVDVAITAPPYPAALGATLTLTRPAFRPEIGFVKVGTGYIATVVWNGEHYQVEAPFFEPQSAPKRWVTPWVGGTLLSDGSRLLHGGAVVNLGSLHVGPSAQAGKGVPPSIGLSGIWTF
jgi:hypothetical protein